MKLTKFVHSCVLVEDDGKTILVDPGQFSWQSGLFKIEALNNLDGVVITHEHFDHFNEEFVRAIISKFPDVLFVSTPAVVEKLPQLGAKQTTTESVDGIEIFSKAKHASLAPLGEAPDNVAVHVNGKITFGGDRHDLEATKDVLALTVTAPWGSMTDAVGMALNLKPKIILPIHDWHWNETARNEAYDRLEAFFGQYGISVLKPVDGQPLDITV